MSLKPPEYFVVVEAFEVPLGIVLLGHSPHADTPWPQPAEVVELVAPDGKRVQLKIAGIDESTTHIPGANPLTRLVLISRGSVQSLSLEGFHVRPLQGPAAI
jgi:hypothetical protein